MQKIKEQLSNTVQEVLDGNFDPLEAYVELDQLKKYIEKCIEEVKPVAITDAQKYPEKTFVNKGYEISYNEGRRSYDFSKIQRWKEQQIKLKAIEDMAKQAAEMYGKSTNLVDENGEVIQPCIVKHSSPFLTIKPTK